MARYGDAQDRLQLHPGQCWSAQDGIGSPVASFYVGDMTRWWQYDAIEEFEADAVFVDPPWSKGYQSMFFGFANLDYRLEFDRFLGILIEDIRRRCPGGPVVIWMGRKATPALDRMLQAAGAWRDWIVEANYGSSCKDVRPFSLWGGSFGGPVVPKPLEGMYEKDVIAWGVENLGGSGKTVYDPCCGKLYFGREFIAAGYKMIGIELIADKLAVGLEHLEKQGFTLSVATVVEGFYG